VVLVPSAWARRTPRLNTALALLALVVLGLAVARLNATSVYPGVLAWWPCGATAVLLWTGQASAANGPAKWLAWRACRYVGDISYGLYLWHYAWLMLPLQMVHPPTSAAATSARGVRSPSMYEDATPSARSSNKASGSKRAEAPPLARTAAMACSVRRAVRTLTSKSWPARSSGTQARTGAPFHATVTSWPRSPPSEMGTITEDYQLNLP